MRRYLAPRVGAILALWLVAGSALEAAALPPGALGVTHGVASGDVTAHSAVIWARASGRSQMLVEYGIDADFQHRVSAGTATASAETDYTAQVKLERLEPDTQYFYRVWFAGPGGPSERVHGQFKTAPASDVSRAVSFVVGGDLGGQGFCRNVNFGYIAFDRMLTLAPDFLIANGDMIYADGECPQVGPLFGGGPGGSLINWINVPGDFPSIASASVSWSDLAPVRDVYWKHWRYNRADESFKRLLQQVPVYAQWDDHEVINDFGAPWDHWNVDTIARDGFPNLVIAGRDAFFHYWPIDRSQDEPNRIYRSFRWGRDLEVFIVDARSYRSRNDLPDTPQNNKTMLGTAQLEWLKQGLLTSGATWKVISLDVPLSLPGGSNANVYGRDEWANGTAPGFAAQTGFERELLDLLTFLDDHRIKNIVIVVTDFHLAANIRYEQDFNGDGDALLFHEFVNGPLSAGANAAPTQRFLDPTLKPTLLYPLGGAYPDGIRFNFGFVRIREDPTDGLAHFVYDVRRIADGLPRPGSFVDLTPR
jgi:alkaline phosphatase D